MNTINLLLLLLLLIHFFWEWGLPSVTDGMLKSECGGIC
jgi:hypothetical protein